MGRQAGAAGGCRQSAGINVSGLGWEVAARKLRVYVLRPPRRRRSGSAGQTDGLPACRAGGRCQLGTRCGLRCAVRCPLGVSKVCRGRASCAAAAAPGLPRGSQAGGPACPGITSLCGWMDGWMDVCLLLRAGGCPGERPVLAQGWSAPAAPSPAGSAAVPARGSWKLLVRNPEVPILD